jgi:hypothetical protein
MEEWIEAQKALLRLKVPGKTLFSMIQSAAGECPKPMDSQARAASSSKAYELLQCSQHGSVIRFDGRGSGKKPFGGT